MFKGHPDKFTLVLIIVFVALIAVGFGAQKYREAYDDTWITPYKTKTTRSVTFCTQRNEKSTNGRRRR